MLNPECLPSNMMFQGELPLAKFQCVRLAFAFGFFLSVLPLVLVLLLHLGFY